MTVCIAAIAERSTVVGASDRMITWGDVQFEPSSMKVFGLTSSIAVMMSGDAALHSEVMLGVRSEIAARLQANPARWLTVQEVADLFVAERNAVKLKRAEAAILQPLGLTSASFLQGMHGLATDVAKAIATDVVHYPLPSSAWIISGVDTTGPHIFTVAEGVLSCNDQIGFAAIGYGARHAESQLMLAEHSHDRSLAETLIMAYTAKKRAEIAPGVGAGTDMFTVGSGLGTLMLTPTSVLSRLDDEFKRLRESERLAVETARKEIVAYVGQLTQTSNATQIADGNTLADEDASDEFTDEELAALDDPEDG